MIFRRARETAIGAVTLGVLVLVLWINAADRDAIGEGGGGYRLSAVFQRTEGLAPGADVRVAGLAVGQVTDQTLDEHFRAHVTLRIDGDVQVPVDSAAIIETDGLLGSKYIELQPGGAEDMLKPGQRIEYVQGSVVIEELLAKVVAQAKAKRAEAASRAARPPVEGGGADTGGESAVPSPFPSLLAPLDDAGGTGQ